MNRGYASSYSFEHNNYISLEGLVALALTQDDAGDNTMEFFITLDAAPELNNKHTIFGKVTGETIYNVSFPSYHSSSGHTKFKFHLFRY